MTNTTSKDHTLTGKTETKTFRTELLSGEVLQIEYVAERHGMAIHHGFTYGPQPPEQKGGVWSNGVAYQRGYRVSRIADGMFVTQNQEYPAFDTVAEAKVFCDALAEQVPFALSKDPREFTFENRDTVNAFLKSYFK